MTDTRWDLRTMDVRLPELEATTQIIPADRAASRAVQAADVTGPIPALYRSTAGCRTRVGNIRCGHEQRAHVEVGFSGWRQRCEGCGCTAWRRPWGHVRAELAIVVLAIVAVVMFVLVLLPAVLEAWL